MINFEAESFTYDAYENVGRAGINVQHWIKNLLHITYSDYQHTNTIDLVYFADYEVIYISG